jgi:enoyl-CoA hydratase
MIGDTSEDAPQRHGSSEVVVSRPSQGVALIRLQAASRKNAFTGDMARALVDALRVVEADANVAAVVISGGSEAFCAGAHRDLLDGVAAGDAQSEADIGAVYEVFSILRSMEAVTVAAVCGPAVGAGLNLALACGVRIVGDNAFLRSMFIANKIHPAGGHLKMLQDIGGRSLAVRLAALDEPLDAAAAVQAGVAIGPVPAPEAEQRAIELVRRVVDVPSLARSINASIRVVTALDDDAAARMEADAQRATLTARGPVAERS